MLDSAPLTNVGCTSFGPLPSVSMNIFTTQNQALPSPVVQSSMLIEAALLDITSNLSEKLWESQATSRLLVNLGSIRVNYGQLGVVNQGSI